MIFPRINANLESEVEEGFHTKKAFKFNFDTRKFQVEDGKLVEISKLDYIKQYINWVLRTFPKKFEIYKDNFGVNYSFISSKDLPIGYINSEMKRQVETQLALHPNILSVSDFKSKRESELLIVSFKVEIDTEKTLEINEEVVIS